MTDIRISKLTLENFKCHKHLVLDLGGGDASVYGDNATGKTSLYDALTWLLFGKDSTGNGEKNMEIKPLGPDGEVKDHLAETAVEAELLVNGEAVKLRRTYREVWTTKRGSSEATYDGNTSEYYVNGVPMKKYAFAEKVDSLVSEDTFRMLTSVSHFAAGIPWQERRAVLFKVAGVMDDREVMASSSAFEPLAMGMGKLSLEEFKRKLLAEKKKYTGAKTEIPARISECEKTIQDVESIDFDDARAQLDALRAQRESVAAELVRLNNSAAEDAKRVEMQEVQLELETLHRENRVYHAQQAARLPDMATLREDLSALRSRGETMESRQRMLETKIKVLDVQLNTSRQRWMDANREMFTSGNCLTCGRELPTQQLEKARAAFEAAKRQRLEAIEQTAQAQKENREQLTAQITELAAGFVALGADLEDKLAEIRQAEAMDCVPEDIDGYTEKTLALNKRLESLSAELLDIRQGGAEARNKLQAAEFDLKQQEDEIRTVLAKEGILTYSRGRVDELREEARAAADALEGIERYLYLMDAYVRYKTRFVEDSINSLFRLATFRLFREQANGGVEDRCDVVLNGVPYGSINNGAKINVGIDIINTLSAAYGVQVPLFVDNAESVTKLEDRQGQIIRLVVSENDKELRVNYEN